MDEALRFSPFLRARRLPLPPLFLSVFLAALLAACGGGESRLAPTDWPGWRGPDGDGVSPAATLPTEWGPESDNILWRAELVEGFGGSSPIVAGGRVYLTAAERAGDEELENAVLAVDEAGGELLWKTVVSRRPLIPLFNRFSSHAGPTPVSDGERIWAYFGADLAALDRDGTILWNREIEPDYDDTTRYGAGSSPVLLGDKLLILQDKEWVEAKGDVGWLAAFDSATGDELWKVEFETGCCSYTTPFVLDRPGGPEVLVALAQKIAAYDPESGELLWEDAQEMNQPVAGPVAEGDLLCLASGAHNVRETVCRRLSGSGAETGIEVLWRSSRGVPETASPVLYEGILYMVVQKGLLSAWDAETGEELWRQRLEGGGAYHASLVAGDGKVYVHSLGGDTAVYAAGREPRLVAVNSLGERSTVASPAVGDGRLYFRTDSPARLVCVGTGGGATAAEPAG